MRFARGFLIFSYGLFTIAAQALLFREFVTTFEGNDISVGIFFGCWFCWVALGAALIYRAKTIADKLLRNIEFLLLAFLPAFVLEWILIVQARELAGVESYTLWSVRDILLLAFFASAPVSIITGMFFPIACRWVQQDTVFAVSRVYILEAAGSFLGGLGTTILLGLGVNSARIFFVLAFILSCSALCVQLGRVCSAYRQIPQMVCRNLHALRGWILLLPVLVLLCLAGGLDKTLTHRVRIMKWTKLLPRDALLGSFQTAQAEYLYGIYQGQWIAVRQGSTCEVLPNRESAGRIAAICLSQNPAAKTVLVVGSGLGLCYQFLQLPQIQITSWAHCDSEYMQKVDAFIPAELKTSDTRFHRTAGDVRSLLGEKKQYYDIVVLNLPEATSSVLNRYYTLEFYAQVKESLTCDGLLAVRVAGGENIMGTELINLGASTKITLQKVFSKLVLVPGEDTWFIASDCENVTGEPGILRDRFAKIEGASRVFSAQALLSVYLPDRAAAALAGYSTADLPDDMLVNQDGRPLTHLYSLLLAAKQSGAPVARLVKHLALAGPLVYVIPILVLIAVRGLYILTQPAGRQSTAGQQPETSSFDSMFLIFSAGLIAIGAVIVLMYLYQTRFGSLYLYVGIISSLFMVGLTAGAAFVTSLVKRVSHPTWLLFAVITGHAVILTAVGSWPSQQQTHTFFAAAFILCGLAAGCYFPLAAKQLADSGFETGRIGSKLETGDHVGATVGGLLTGLAFVPVLGTKATLFVFILLVLANVPLIAMSAYKRTSLEFRIANLEFQLRRLGYVLFGIGASIVVCSNLLAEAGTKLRPALPPYAAQALAGQLRIEQASTVLADSGRKVSHFSVHDANDRLTGYIFSSEDLAPEVRGFGGKMNLAVYVDPNGSLINFHILSSNETPAYLDLLGDWQNGLKGHKLFQPQPFAAVDAVTGATISSQAILSAIEKSSHRFAWQVLGQTIEAMPTGRIYQAKYLPDRHAVYLVAAFSLALIVIYHGGFWSRLAVLTLNLAVGGILLNAQFSSEQIATLLSFNAPVAGLTGVFLLVVAVPLLVALFGNIYCGYICPFGAAQELLGHIIPQRFKPTITVKNMRIARFIKYAVLFLLIIIFFLSRDRTTLGTDPLISIFNFQFRRLSILVVAAIALVGSVFYTRFWCRYLCPAGAFLSLLNKVAILKRHLPAKRFGFCEFGLTHNDQLDCIYCDRCRFEQPSPVTRAPLFVPERRATSDERHSFYFVVGVLAVGTLLSAISVKRFMQVIPAGIEHPVAAASSAGQPRDVDLQRIRTMIEQKKLSDREAEFYKKIE
jgi:predicted membrane-bound spermidine synthase